jgi:hypothetical protein
VEVGVLDPLLARQEVRAPAHERQQQVQQGDGQPASIDLMCGSSTVDLATAEALRVRYFGIDTLETHQ